MELDELPDFAGKHEISRLLLLPQNPPESHCRFNINE